MPKRQGKRMATAVTLDHDYRPSEDEPFMNERQRQYFRKKLLVWKDEILREARETIANLQNDSENHPDIADRASRLAEAERWEWAPLPVAWEEPAEGQRLTKGSCR